MAIEARLCCDGCGRELKPSLSLLMESQTKEWPMKNFVLCEGCAAIIDYSVLKFRESIGAKMDGERKGDDA